MTNLAIATGLDRLPATDRPLLWQFGMDRTTAPSHDRIQAAFEEWAQRTPDAIAVVQGAEQVTYAELDRRANCLASLLRVHRVRAGDRVGLFLRQSVPMIVGMLATLKIGAAYVPQDARRTSSQHLGHIVTHARIHVVLTLAEHVGRIPRAKGQAVIALDALALDALKYDGSIPLWSESEGQPGTAVVIFASGTTGRPNAVPVTHADLCRALLTGPGSRGSRAGMRVAHTLDTASEIAVSEIFAALSHGATLVLSTPAVSPRLGSVPRPRR